MSDLISRAELFDELNRRGVPYNAEVNMVINGMPSAQPEIIRCKDCEWWTKQPDSIQGRCDLMQMYPSGGWYCGNAQSRCGRENSHEAYRR